MSLRLASVAWRRDSTSPKNQYRDGNVKTLGTKLATIVIWEGRWIILAPFILMWVSGPPGRVAFCESGGSYNRAVVIKSTYLWTLLSSDHTGLKASYWPKSVGSCLSLDGDGWALSRGEMLWELCGGRGSDKPGIQSQRRPGHIGHMTRVPGQPQLLFFEFCSPSNTMVILLNMDSCVIIWKRN